VLHVDVVKQTAEETLSDWASDISNLLGLVEKTTHLINKERMVSQAGINESINQLSSQ
jgi:hypothetical protein